mgnify:CR=1 FL=1
MSVLAVFPADIARYVAFVKSSKPTGAGGEGLGPGDAAASVPTVWLATSTATAVVCVPVLALSRKFNPRRVVIVRPLPIVG